ncbi:hypothetical protein [Novosphingobium sp.]|jgi:hypothetical protein|uniref:hypothetical protein n=1 Tax=Novosphingobium sp. TaxID=1874826 RepID=UPI001EC63314|nr:hypothetical protein [Novosphingobium sp.]MBK6801645.1 hypothetical protein [Novosphingobium sp.]MBK9009987.1 hypothetical protein [Novosphingobium sp.]
MKQLPSRYLYLVDIETEKVLRVFSLDEFTRELEIISYESQLRTRYYIDDPETGLALRDSLLSPISPA